MYIEKLKLKNYRNYNELEINFDKNINIIYGNNAEGKTNLLESIYMCSASKSHKNSKENEIIKFDESEAHIKIFIKKENDKNIIIDIQLNKDKKKGIAINKVKINKTSEFLGTFNAIMFAPEDLNIIKEGPSIRRKFLDLEICQIDKLYVNSLNNYNKTLNQRNALLKDINLTSPANKKDLIEMLDTYDEKLVEYGTEIIIKRKKNIKKLAELIKDIHYKISDDKEELIIDYENDVWASYASPNLEANCASPNLEANCASPNLEANCASTNVWASYASPEVIKKVYIKKLKENRDQDIKNQYTEIGPHRDDISFKIDDNDIRKFGSQGQKKTAAISLKLAELQIVKENINETPVLLLDDVFSELDEKRQKLLVSNLKNIQTIITCTGIKKNIFDLLNPNKIFQVKNNSIITKQ